MLIVTPAATLFYEIYGTGNRHLFLFHGAGQDHTLFQALANALPEYTCYTFDLFFHGQSTWTPAQPITPAQWQTLIANVCERHDIHTFDVLGYSIGSRFALATLITCPQYIQQITLVAPDALSVSPWYTLATQTAAARWLFKQITQHHRIFFGLVDVASTLLPAQQRRFRFAQRQMDTAEKRQRIYRAWTTFRKLAFPTPQIAATINKHNIKLTVIVGQQDLVIPAHTVKKLLSQVPGHTLHTLPAGHNRLITEITANPYRYLR